MSLNLNSKLWYQRPARAFKEALPLGNGHMGAMVYGSCPGERISLNSDTLWSGVPGVKEVPVAAGQLSGVRSLIFNGKYHEAEKLMEQDMLGCWNESYMPLGTLHISYNDVADFTEYRRELDLETAVASASFQAHGSLISSEVFVSYPANVMAVRIVSPSAQRLNLTVGLESRLQCRVGENGEDGLVLYGNAPSHVEPNYVSSRNPVVYDTESPGMRFHIHLKAAVDHGKVSAKEGKITIENASEVLLLLSTANGYRGYDSPLEVNDRVLESCCRERITASEKKGYLVLKEEHIADHRSLYGRVGLQLGDEERAMLPTDERIRRFKRGERDNGLFSLLFNYGRYLLTASSREGSQPANLQGIWNEDMRPAWSSNWTTNINVEMNYWPAGVCNLSDCEAPLIDMVRELKDSGVKTAELTNHCSGFAVNHNVDIWRQTAPVSGLAKYAYWPMAGVWLCANLYEHYRFTRDSEYLIETCYPVMKGAALFCLDWLVEGEDGKLHTCPSTSPENSFFDSEGRPCSVSYSSTMDMALIKELFGNIIEANERFHMDDGFAAVLAQKLPLLPGFKIGRYGQLQEWIEDFREVDAGHRHFAPVVAFHPFALINQKDTPGLVQAVKRLIDRRLENSSGHIGWNCAWLIGIFARLRESGKAYDYCRQFITHAMYDNLFGLHPPLGETEGELEVFQIDGNLGAVAGIAEMLLQSHLNEILLLPALPEEWDKGSVTGLKARGGFEVNIEWSSGKLVLAKIKPVETGRVKVRYGETSIEFDAEAGIWYEVAGNRDSLITGFKIS
ncbi:glycoside hydrolase family 95 protein [Ruminiclostridium cellobioparum]|uniref:Uncharacterized protein n=1 Tax=Ruminiclostridium cellobioparum subsp. termitidis CT1112 TaxID=1195236 RepID=S0FKQ3_RUMCE|nr:glycoside hydrolase family 95 protein [Ruminiclostridium cellobioparum]EMS69769.1 hypothetical protein CTER_4752 [Ruminiclostridium cellobioparum subsp. termitidis CT1112]